MENVDCVLVSTILSPSYSVTGVIVPVSSPLIVTALNDSRVLLHIYRQ